MDDLATALTDRPHWELVDDATAVYSRGGPLQVRIRRVDGRPSWPPHSDQS